MRCLCVDAVIDLQNLRPSAVDNKQSQLTRILCTCIYFLLIAFVSLPAARAENAYAGILYGQAEMEKLFTRNIGQSGVEVESSRTENLGFVIGRSPAKGVGYEFFYAPTIAKDSTSVDSALGRGPESVDITLDIYGLLAYYKTGTDDFGTYLKLKGGAAVVDLEFDFDGIGSFDDDTSGIVFGITIGFPIGSGDLELTYLILPRFKDFDGLDISRDIDVNLFDLSYQWHF